MFIMDVTSGSITYFISFKLRYSKIRRWFWTIRGIKSMAQFLINCKKNEIQKCQDDKIRKETLIIDMVVEAQAPAKLRLVSVFARIPPPTTIHPPPPTHSP